MVRLTVVVSVVEETWLTLVYFLFISQRMEEPIRITLSAIIGEQEIPTARLMLTSARP